MNKYKLNLKDRTLDIAKIRYTEARKTAPGTALRWQELSPEQQVELAKRYESVAAEQLAYTAQKVISFLHRFLSDSLIASLISSTLIAEGLLPEPEEPAAVPSEPGEDALSVLQALMTNPHLNLGDLVYLVREREGKGWEGPAVEAWGNAVGKAEELLKAAAAEGHEG